MRTNRAKDVRINVVPDIQTREAIRLLADTLGLVNVAIDWSQLEISNKPISTAEALPHSLSAVPTDILTTWVEWTGTVGTFSWDYSKFTKDNVYYTCTQPIKVVRAIVGRRG